MSDVFISYSRKDREFVKKVHDSLSEIDRDTWVDWEDIPPTAEWLNEIFAAIDAADTFVFVISPASIGSETCRKEIAHSAKNNKRIVPIVCRDVDSSSVPEDITKLNWIFFRDNDDFDSAFQTLIKAIDTDLDYVRAHTRLLVRAREWDSKNNDRSFLLSGNDLKEAEDWLALSGGKEPKPTSLQTRFIISSRKASIKRQRIILGAVTFGLVVAVLLASLAFYLYKVSEKRRTIALSRQLAAQAEKNSNQQLDLALLLSLESDRTESTIESRSSLFDILSENQKITSVLLGHNNAVRSMVFDAQDNSLISASGDGEIIIWDTNSQKPIRKIKPEKNYLASSATLSPDGEILASALMDSTIILQDSETRRQIGKPLTGHKTRGAIRNLAFSPDGKLLASGGFDGSLTKGIVILWNIESGKQINYDLSNLDFGVSALEFSPDGKLLASGGANNRGDGTIIVWDVETGNQAGKPLVSVNSPVGVIKFSPDSKLLLSGHGSINVEIGGDIYFWDLATSEQSRRPYLIHRNRVSALEFSPDGNVLASGDVDGNIHLFDLQTRKLMGNSLVGQGGSILSLEFSPDGHTLASGSGALTGGEGKIALWDAFKEHQLGEYVEGIITGATNSMVLSPDGKILFTGHEDGKLIYWDFINENEINQAVRDHNSAITSLVLAPDGKTLAYAIADGQIILRDVKSGEKVAEIPNLRNWRPYSLAFSPDGMKLAFVLLDLKTFISEVLLWNLETGKEIGKPLKKAFTSVRSLTFSPDGKQLVFGYNDYKEFSKGEMIFWNIETGNPIGEPLTAHERQISNIKYSPDAKVLASSGFDGSIILWDANTGERIGSPLNGHSGPIYDINFSPDGKTLISGGLDKKVIIWDVESGNQIGSGLLGHKGAIHTLVFSPDGKKVISGGLDNYIIIWDVDRDRWQERACEIANRNLSWSEWEKYIGEEPYSKTCKELPADPSLIEHGRSLAKKGDIKRAIRIFRLVKKLDPEENKNLDPALEARKLAAEVVN